MSLWGHCSLNGWIRSLPVVFSNSRSLPVKRECDFQFPFPFPGVKKPFPLTPDVDQHQFYFLGNAKSQSLMIKGGLVKYFAISNSLTKVQEKYFFQLSLSADPWSHIICCPGYFFGKKCKRWLWGDARFNPTHFHWSEAIQSWADLLIRDTPYCDHTTIRHTATWRQMTLEFGIRQNPAHAIPDNLIKWGIFTQKSWVITDLVTQMKIQSLLLQIHWWMSISLTSKKDSWTSKIYLMLFKIFTQTG